MYPFKSLRYTFVSLQASVESQTKAWSFVHLNVGGVIYSTSVKTLTTCRDSMLANMFTQNAMMPAEMDEHGHFMIDRDGLLFRHILNYLRNGELNLPDNFGEHKQLLAEATFYQIDPLMKEINSYFDKDGRISLNVGGKCYMTSKYTLTKFQDSVLCKMLTDGDQSIRRDDGGRFIIDRDGQLFRYVLNYLRDGMLSLPKDFTELKQLSEEARFYGIRPLIEELANQLEDEEDINFIVGGVPYKTKKENLTKQEGSAFQKMFTNKHTFRKDTEGRYIIDADGQMFRHILDFMEKGKLHLPLDFRKHQMLCNQASGFDLQGMVTAIHERQAGLDFIPLNVGGVEYIVQRKTLCNMRQTWLWQMFNTEDSQPTGMQQGIQTDEKGNYMIDRDGALFRHVLDFIRDDKLSLPNGFCQHKQLMQEAIFYKINKLIITMRPFCL